jgi:hypothetical protein
MALMAFQFENADAIRIESGSNVTLANIASKAVVQVATALSSQGTAFGRTTPRRQADRRQGHYTCRSCLLHGAGGAPASMKSKGCEDLSI